jgi:hypothetical protein
MASCDDAGEYLHASSSSFPAETITTMPFSTSFVTPRFMVGENVVPSDMLTTIGVPGRCFFCWITYSTPRITLATDPLPLLSESTRTAMISMPFATPYARPYKAVVVLCESTVMNLHNRLSNSLLRLLRHGSRGRLCLRNLRCHSHNRMKAGLRIDCARPLLYQEHILPPFHCVGRVVSAGLQPHH